MECSTLMTNEILTKAHSITYQRKSFFVRLAGSRKQEMREEANFDETLEGKKSDNGGRPIGTMLLAAATMTSIFRVIE